MSPYGDKRLKVFSGSTSRVLAEEICQYMGVPLADTEVGRFSDGEIKVIINENVRGCDAFVVQSTCTPVNDSLMELLILIDALKRASADRITAVIPYYGYARQDRKTRGREPITAKLVANLLTEAGADRVLSIDLHSGQIQGFFDIPVDHLTAIGLLADYIKDRDLSDYVVVSPDAGSIPRARDMAERLKLPVAFIDKRRPQPNVAEVMNIVGKVQDRHAILLDDMIDTGGSLLQATMALRNMGAKSVMACATHPIFSGNAKSNIEKCEFSELIVTNTIPIEPEIRPLVKVLSVAPLLGDAIIRIHEGRSVSEMFR
ncbi:MAG TPA: ribose-phosphate pyrophosphokinase [Firmicutes bacterium]|nr:ribose-phosphate pyrophosphokinase [Candidatus Fermentithermobacillaceae bacterium]